MNSILYLSYYDVLSAKENRKYVLSSKNKSDYIIEALEKNGLNVYLLSASGASGRGYFPSRIENIGTRSKLRIFSSIGDSNIIKKIVDRNLIKVKVFFELLKQKKDTPVIVYHSLGYMNIVNIAHKLKKFRLILEVEEIYSDVIGNKRKREKEIEFLKDADSYIIPTELLKNTINICDKPSVIVHGTYHVEKNRALLPMKNADGGKQRIIHCIYSGTFDPRKGAILAVNTAMYLPSNYHIHIIGFGNEHDTEMIKETILSISSKCCAKVTFDGYKTGEEYILFIQSCKIGLCTQDFEAEYNLSSFPSKILSYLSNGLRVVSVRIPAIVNSAVGDLLYYYDGQSAKNIANTILSIDVDDSYDSRKTIENLNNLFVLNLKLLIFPEEKHNNE